MTLDSFSVSCWLWEIYGCRHVYRYRIDLKNSAAMPLSRTHVINPQALLWEVSWRNYFLSTKLHPSTISPYRRKHISARGREAPVAKKANKASYLRSSDKERPSTSTRCTVTTTSVSSINHVVLLYLREGGYLLTSVPHTKTISMDTQSHR